MDEQPVEVFIVDDEQEDIDGLIWLLDSRVSRMMVRNFRIRLLTTAPVRATSAAPCSGTAPLKSRSAIECSANATISRNGKAMLRATASDTMMVSTMARPPRTRTAKKFVRLDCSRVLASSLIRPEMSVSAS